MTAEALSASLEDYLESVYLIAQECKVARANQISGRLGVNMSTVSWALKQLSGLGLINYAPYQVVTMTNKGRKRAEEIVRRHDVLKRFLTEVLSIKGPVAEVNACRMEHAVDRAVLDRLLQFIEFIEECPRGGLGWLKEFGAYCRRGLDKSRCRECIETCLDALDSAGDASDEAEEPAGVN